MARVDPNNPRERRSDGERTHAAILDAATRVASIEGVEGLTIGRLARELGVSKSGVYAHFGSKEALQRETITAAAAVFEREVIGPAMASPQGLPRLRALVEAHLSYVQRLVFPGGCFFASLLAEMDARPGAIRDELQRGVDEWGALMTDIIAAARELGHLPADAEPERLAFTIDACLELANYHFVLSGRRAVIDRAHDAIEAILTAAGAPAT